MHTYDESTDDLAEEIVSYSLARIRMDPPPLDKPRTPDELRTAIGPTVTPDGIGGHEAFRLFVEEIAPATISIDHPRYLSFVPGAPTEAAALFDLIVGASSMYGGSWMEASGAVHAENEALRWVSDLAGFPEGAGGAFVSGGTGGNLSALVTARHHAAPWAGSDRPAGRCWPAPAPTARSTTSAGSWTSRSCGCPSTSGADSPATTWPRSSRSTPTTATSP